MCRLFYSGRAPVIISVVAISIYLFVNKMVNKPDVRSKINFITDLIFRIGEQKIDVVLDNPAMRKSQFLKTIYSTGIQLC
jgi:hypothetical protein